MFPRLNLRSLPSRLHLFLLAWLVPAAQVLAQQPTPEGPDNKSYVSSYMIVALAAGLGVWVTVRNMHRAAEERTDLHAGKAPTGVKGQEFHT